MNNKVILDSNKKVEYKTQVYFEEPVLWKSSSFYRFNGNTLPTIGSVSGTTHGTINYGSSYGYMNQGIDFNQVDYNCVEFSSALITGTTTDLTITCWCNLLTTSGSGYMVNVGSVSNGFGFGVTGDGPRGVANRGNKYFFILNNIILIVPETLIGTGWHLIGIQRKGGSWYSIIDDQITSLNESRDPITPSNSTFVAVGDFYYSYNPYYLWFPVDEVAFFYRALGVDEVRSIYNYKI